MQLSPMGSARWAPELQVLAGTGSCSMGSLHGMHHPLGLLALNQPLVGAEGWAAAGRRFSSAQSHSNDDFVPQRDLPFL